VASGRFQHVVELSLLEALRPELLLALLTPHKDALAAFGIVVDRSAYSSAWLLRLHSVVNRDDAELPAPLQAALMDIADLSTDAGGELIISEARRCGIELSTSGDEPTQDLAVSTYLAHPDLFRVAHSRLQVARRTMFHEFYGSGQAQPLPRNVDRQLKILKKRLREEFISRHRSGSCRLLLDDRKGELVVVIGHARLPSRSTLIGTRHRRELRTYVTEAHDVIIYDKAADRLSVEADCPSDVDLYRAVMGYLFALDEAYFQPYPTFRAEPFKERGSAALDVGRIAGLDRVVLRAVTLLGRSRDQIVRALASEDLRAWLDEAFESGTLSHLTFGAWTFGVFMPELNLPLEVELRPPNQLSFDRRLPIGRFRPFLIAAGFEVMPKGESGGS
jgi:hypothetical protein